MHVKDPQLLLLLGGDEDEVGRGDVQAANLGVQGAEVWKCFTVLLSSCNIVCSTVIQSYIWL